MSYLTEKQKAKALDLIESAGEFARELNEQLKQHAQGNLDRKSLQELPHRIAAINAQIKAGVGMVAAHATFTDAGDFLMRKVEGKQERVALEAATAKRPHKTASR